jgi:hypothetical protein
MRNTRSPITSHVYASGADMTLHLSGKSEIIFLDYTCTYKAFIIIKCAITEECTLIMSYK